VLVDSTGLKVYGAGQWLEEKHGVRSRRSWRKLHLAVDANSGEIIAHKLTDQDMDDPSQVEPLLSQIDGGIDQFTADGAYDGKPTYRSVLQHIGTASVVIPPRSTAVESGFRRATRSTGQAHRGNRERRSAAMAGRYRLRPARSDRNRHRAIQGFNRTTPAGSFVRHPADRGRHRLHRSQPHAGVETGNFFGVTRLGVKAVWA
jgi:hypothetical protein